MSVRTPIFKMTLPWIILKAMLYWGGLFAVTGGFFEALKREEPDANEH